MNTNDFNDIAKNLEAKGFPPEDSEEIVEYAKMMMIGQEAEKVTGLLAKKAALVRALLESAFEAVKEEPGLDVRLPVTDVMRISGNDYNILLFCKLKKVRGSAVLNLEWKTEDQLDVNTSSKEISLGDVHRLSENRNNTRRSRYTLFAVQIADSEKKRKAVKNENSDSEFILQLNTRWIENNLAEPFPDKEFYKTSEFLNYLSDHYQESGYKSVVKCVLTLPGMLENYFQGKKSFLSDLDI